MRTFAPIVFSLGLLASGLRGAPAATDLLPGPAFAGWEFVTTPATRIGTVCSVGPDGVIHAAGKPIGYLTTTATYANYRLHAEWRWPGQPGNGGVLVHISSGPKDRAWPICFQIQLKHQNAGDLLPMAGASFAEKLSTPPDAKTPILHHVAPDQEAPVGSWNTCDITCRGDTIEVVVNGVLQNRVTRVRPDSGQIGFQFEGNPFELRRVHVVRLD